MRTPVEYPRELPAPRSEHARSRRPVIVFGPRGPVDRSGWTAEERAIMVPAPGGPAYPNRYLGAWIRLDDPGDEAQTRAAFGQVALSTTLATVTGSVGICVPRWHDLPLVVRERLRVAVRYQVRGAVDGSAADLARLTDPLPLLHVSTRRTPATLAPVREQRLSTSETHHLEWLRTAVPGPAQITEAIRAAAGLDEGAGYRKYDAARRVAAGLRAEEWPRRQIAEYLGVFGYVNSKGIVGVWPEKRLAEVAPVMR